MSAEMGLVFDIAAKDFSKIVGIPVEWSNQALCTSPCRYVSTLIARGCVAGAGVFESPGSRCLACLFTGASEDSSLGHSCPSQPPLLRYKSARLIVGKARKRRVHWWERTVG